MLPNLVTLGQTVRVLLRRSVWRKRPLASRLSRVTAECWLPQLEWNLSRCILPKTGHNGDPLTLRQRWPEWPRDPVPYLVSSTCLYAVHAAGRISCSADIVADGRGQLPAKWLRRYAQTASAASSEAGFAASGRHKDHRALLLDAEMLNTLLPTHSVGLGKRQ